MCDEDGKNCMAEEKSGRESGCTDNPGMDEMTTTQAGPHTTARMHVDPTTAAPHTTARMHVDPTTSLGGPHTTAKHVDPTTSVGGPHTTAKHVDPTTSLGGPHTTAKHTSKPSPSPTGMFDGSDPDTPRDPGCCMALDWSESDATKCINAYKASYCDNESGWENCQWIHDHDHMDQVDCEQPAGHDVTTTQAAPHTTAKHVDPVTTMQARDPGCCMALDWSVKDATKCINAYSAHYCDTEHGWENCQWIHDDNHVDQMDCEQPAEEEDCETACTKEFMPYCCDGVTYNNDCLGYCAGAHECLGMKDPSNTCTESSEEDVGCCYASDPNNRMASKCYDIDASACANGGRMGCAWMSGQDADCSLPTAEPGCCAGSDKACDTDDEMMCGKAKRKGCSWMSGADADCEPVPGCCSGMDAMCFGIDEAMCVKNSKRKGCEWISGTTECVPPTAEPGCCYGSDNACDTDDEMMCGKAKRKGCSWMSGHDADCTIVTTEPEGCCAGSDNACDTDDEMMCGKAKRKGCSWMSFKHGKSEADCAMENEMFFAGHGVAEVMNSQVSLSTLLLCMVCLVALWKVYGCWSSRGGYEKVQPSAQVDGQGYYQSV